MKTVERKLFHEDKDLFNEIHRDLNEMKPLLLKVKESYESLNIGEFTNEIFKEVVGTDGSKKILKKFYSDLNSQLDKMNVTSAVMREKMIEDHSDLVNSFNESINQLKAFKPYKVKMVIGDRMVYLKPNQVSFVNTSFCLSKDDAESILEEHCRTYIADEEIVFLEKFESFIQSYSSLKEHMLMNSFSNGFRLSHISNLIVEGENDGSGFLKSCKVEISKKAFIGMINMAKYVKSNF